MKIEIYSPTIRRKEMDAVLTAMVEEKIGPGARNRLLIQTAKEQLRFDYALALRSPAVALLLRLRCCFLHWLERHWGSRKGMVFHRISCVRTLYQMKEGQPNLRL